MSTIPQIIQSQQLSTVSTIDFLKLFFHNAGFETYHFKGVDYIYLSSGSTRHVYVHPDLSHVIKVPYSDFTEDLPRTGNKFNAIEVWDCLDSIHDEYMPKVHTEFFGYDNRKLIIKQDFLIVMNTHRTTINPIFDEIFQPEWSRITETYGYQYGWNKRTQQIELYDTSDAYISEKFFSHIFSQNYDPYCEDITKSFNAERLFRQVDYKNKLIQHFKDNGLWSTVLGYDPKRHHWTCKLKHQNGILIDVKSGFNDSKDDFDFNIEICGDAITYYAGRLDEVIENFKRTYKYNEAKLYSK